MEPKEKARNMVSGFGAAIFEKDKNIILSWMRDKERFGVPLVAKQCALISVDEISGNLLEGLTWNELIQNEALHKKYIYWQEVREELGKL